MLDRAFLVSNIFKVINFVLLISAFAYIFKRYLLSSVEYEMEQERMQFQNLKNSIHSFSRQVEDIDLEIKLQKKEDEVLISRIKDWADIVEENRLKTGQSFKSNLEKAQNRAKQQERFLQESIVLNKVAPLVLDDLQKQAADKFFSAKSKKDFLSDVLASIKKRV